MTLDESRRGVWRSMRRTRGHDDDGPVLNMGGGGDNSGGMEARIARLEASMEFVKAELVKLAGLPAEVARIAEKMNHVPSRAEIERLSHVPTRIEVRNEIEAAVDRAASRTQRTVAITGGLVTIAIAVINYLPKLLH